MKQMTRFTYRPPLCIILLSLELVINIISFATIPYQMHLGYYPSTGPESIPFHISAIIKMANIISIIGMYLFKKWGVGGFIAAAVFAIGYSLYLQQPVSYSLLYLIDVALIALALFVGKEHSVWRRLQ